jgi:enolase
MFTTERPMSKIKVVTGREILDSRGNPTVEVEIVLNSGQVGRMMVPSGASTGKFEALELRDGDRRFRGKGVLKAVEHVNTAVKRALTGRNPEEQEQLDQLLIELDGTADKSKLGANALLGSSFAVAHAAANEKGLPLYQYIAEKYLPSSENLALPVPMVNIISGGLHAGRNVDLQDFLIIPVSTTSYKEALEMISAVYWQTRDLLNQKGHNAYLLADEGGFGPRLSSNEEGLDILCEVFVLCGYKLGKDIAIALDVASSHFYDQETKQYRLYSEKRSLDSDQMVNMLEQWTKDYPIVSIEDGLSEDDWEGWQQLTVRLGKKVQLVGDDLFATNPQRIQKGIDIKAGNAVLIKMNQIGTLTETASAVKLAKEAGFKTVISARSGETEDATLADLAVGLGGGQIKIGSLAGSSRLAKYNQLIRINEQLNARYARWPLDIA